MAYKKTILTKMKKSLIIATSALTITACAQLDNTPEKQAPKNIIYMIGDGMGPAYTTAYRYYNDDINTKEIEKSVFDTILTGTARTYPDDDTYVTDSAASATALSSGIKSYNGAIAVDTNKKPVKTMLELAKEKDMLTALVVTSQINHATPASFTAHNESRRNYDQIANDYIDNKINGKLPVDLMFGGGTDYFIREDRNLVNEFLNNNYQYADTLGNINTITQIPAIGLFDNIGLPYAIDSTKNHLEVMTKKALNLVDKQSDNGFFMMIEGSQIDWCGHNNDITCAMAEMHDFANSIKLAKKYVDNNPDTILVVTADHSTGGLTVGANHEYKWDAQVVKDFKVSARKLSRKLFKNKDLTQEWDKYSSTALSDKELQTLKAAKVIDEPSLFIAVKHIINTRSYTGWTTNGHTAMDVQVFSYGKGAEHFTGSLNNTDIAKQLIKFIKS